MWENRSMIIVSIKGIQRVCNHNKGKADLLHSFLSNTLYWYKFNELDKVRTQ